MKFFVKRAFYFDFLKLSKDEYAKNRAKNELMRLFLLKSLKMG